MLFLFTCYFKFDVRPIAQQGLLESWRNLVKRIREHKDDIAKIAKIQTSIGFEERNEDFVKLVNFLNEEFPKKKKWKGRKEAWVTILACLERGLTLNWIQKAYFRTLSSSAFYTACSKLRNQIESAKSNPVELEKIRTNQTTLEKDRFTKFIPIFCATARSPKRKVSTSNARKNKRKKK